GVQGGKGWLAAVKAGRSGSGCGARRTLDDALIPGPHVRVGRAAGTASGSIDPGRHQGGAGAIRRSGKDINRQSWRLLEDGRTTAKRGSLSRRAPQGAGSISCNRLTSTDTSVCGSPGRNMDRNRAFQTISSTRYDERACTVCANVSSMPDSRTRISAWLCSSSSRVLSASGLASSIGCTIVQDSGKNVTLF